MPQDAPADTAGPSSPPPRMPEGWLPQWEGVQRKWYYVQRATGKSQWEIPTEPVVLTPSTTPTSIGTGPTQAPPSRPSTNSPQVSGLRGTIVERIEAVADSAKNSSSFNAQLNGQPGNTGHSGHSGPTDWYPEQNNQHGSHVYGQVGPSSINAYGLGQNHQSPGNMNAGSSSHYPHHSPPNQMIAQQPFAGNPWAQSSNALTGQAGGINTQHYQFHSGLYQNPPVNLHDGQSSGNKADLHPPQPEWRVKPQRPPPTAQRQTAAQSLASGDPSQPYYQSNPTSQISDWSRGNAQSTSQLFHSSLPASDHSGSDTGQQKHIDSFPTQFPTPASTAQSTASYQMARSNSHQAAFPGHGPGSVGSLPSHEYTQHPHTSSQYSNNMTRSQSGTNFDSMGYPPGPEPQSNARFYQNPLVQAGMHHYQSPQPPSQPVSNLVPHEFYQNSHLPNQQQQWPNSDPRLSRVSGSDPQFISGPWGSRPPT